MNEQSLFLRALDLPAGKSRRIWLEQECDDPEQRARIAALLTQHEKAGSFLEKPPVELQNQQEERQQTTPGGVGESSQSRSKAVKPTRLEKPISKEKFVERLIRSKLMTEDEVAECDSTLASVQESSDARTYAFAMVNANKLTGFQAKAIYDGRIKGLTFGEYIILDQLGKGGMGIVYRAKHRRMDRLVAIKVLPRFAMATKGLTDRFYREVKTAAKLMHPNIVAALDASEDDGLHYLVMEYVDGKDLGKVLKQSGPLQIDHAIDCVIQAARGLQFAHEQGVIHRDIKPANLLMDGHGTVKILDMGLARLTRAAGDDADGSERDSTMTHSSETARTICERLNLSLEDDSATINDDTRLTMAGEVMGTLDYMPPEQFTDSRHVDERGDIYSLGCTLYRLLTGHRPFPAETLGAIYHAHLHTPIPSIRAVRPDVNEQIDHVFQRMLSKEPEQRQCSMSEVIQELEASRIGQAPPQSSSFPTVQHDDSESAFDPQLLNALSSVTSESELRVRSNERRSQRKSSVRWITTTALAAALLLIATTTLVHNFAGSERTVTASNTALAPNDDEMSIQPSTNGRTIPMQPVPEIQETPPVQSRRESDEQKPPVLPSDAETVRNEEPAEDEPHEPNDGMNNDLAATEMMNNGLLSDQPLEPGRTHPQMNPSDQSRVNSEPQVSPEWNGGFMTWFGGLNQGGANPFANRTFEFNDNGQRVSISQNSEGITVSIDGRVIKALTPAELKKKDAKAFQLFEKVFGLPNFNANTLDSAQEMQRKQLEQLREKHSGNPQLKSLIERMMRDANNLP